MPSRLACCACSLLAFTAQAHVVRFQFLVPDQIARSDGGAAVLQWLAGPDPTGAAEFSLYAARDAIPPFGTPRFDATIDANSRPPVDGILAWDVSALSPGCYQPFAQVDDQTEGTTWRPAEGIIAVGPNDGGHVPPALWVLSSASQPVSPDGGLSLRVRIDDPDDASSVSVHWVHSDGGSGLIGAPLRVVKGGATVSVGVSPSAVPPGEGSYLRLDVQSDDGQTCSAWWGGRLVPVVSSSADAGAADAGSAKTQPVGCGCGARGPGGLALLTLLRGLTARRPPPAARRSTACEPTHRKRESGRWRRAPKSLYRKTSRWLSYLPSWPY